MNKIKYSLFQEAHHLFQYDPSNEELYSVRGLTLSWEYCRGTLSTTFGAEIFVQNGL